MEAFEETGKEPGVERGGNFIRTLESSRCLALARGVVWSVLARTLGPTARARARVHLQNSLKGWPQSATVLFVEVRPFGGGIRAAFFDGYSGEEPAQKAPPDNAAARGRFRKGHGAGPSSQL